jgi:rhamnose utilization protein RhaD (predicted bifunctional aldolase and dehydrogenase)
MHSTENLKDGYVGSGTRLKHLIYKHGKEIFNMEILVTHYYHNKLIIKSSGISLHQVSILNGFTFCDLVDELPTFDSEYEYINFFNDKIINGDLNPSMEIGFHIKLKSKIVVHTHPIFLNIILCSLESKSIIDMLFKDLKYKYIDYYTPGYELCNNISKIDENITDKPLHNLFP